VIFFFLQINFLTREFEASFISGILVILSLIFRGTSVYFMFNKSSNEFIKQKV
jgi:hypothetical protein